MIINRWSDDMDAPFNNPVYIGYSGNPSEETWTKKDGTHIKVGDMSDSHIYNCYNMVKNSDRLFWSQVFKAEIEKRVGKAIEEMPSYKIQLESFNLPDNIPNEMTKIADEMQKAISDAYTKKLRADERKLEEVLRENGWHKASDIFADIKKQMRLHKATHCGQKFYYAALEDAIEELESKYTGGSTL